jgi:hypothetical protein
MSADQGAALLRLAVLRKQVRQCHADLDAGAAAWLRKPGSSKPRSARLRLYLHALCVEDITIQSLLREDAPLFTSLSRSLGGPDDVAAIRKYARAVHASTDAYLADLPSTGLDRVVDLRKLGLGRRSLVWVTRRFVVQELAQICSEIAGDAGASRTARIRQTRASVVMAPGVV